MRRLLYILSVLLLTVSAESVAQNSLDSLLTKLDPQRFADAVKKKADKLEQKLLEKSMKVLDKMQQHEEKLYSKMLKGKDSLLARTQLAELKQKYSSLKDDIRNPAVLTRARQYIPKLDSFNTTLKFLDAGGMSDKVKDALAKTELLKNKFQQAEEITKFIKQRREQLKQQLEKLGMVKQLKQINKQVYYYAAQVKEYKEILNDPKKIEKKALELLSKTKLWKDFFRKHSMLASLFRIPDPDQPVDPASLAGLQTRAQINNLIQNQLAAGGPNAGQQLQQNLQAAQSELNELKSKILKAGGGGSDADLAEGFKPNNQKTKSFLQRLEYGTNLQTQKAGSFFPVTSDLGLSLGYKLNDKSVIGIGASYKMGWGRGWNDISITHQGIGLRTYVDWKIKGSFWLSAGYEQNYKSAFSDFEQLKNRSGWLQSGLLGISKTVSIKSKLFKKTKLMLLWDFLSYEQVPRGQPVVFRIGYNIK